MEKKATAEFQLIKNGPLKVTGHFRITGTDGNRINTDKEVYLCRCGGSSQKPFCDGTHKKTGFNG